MLLTVVLAGNVPDPDVTVTISPGLIPLIEETTTSCCEPAAAKFKFAAPLAVAFCDNVNVVALTTLATVVCGATSPVEPDAAVTVIPA